MRGSTEPVHGPAVRLSATLLWLAYIVSSYRFSGASFLYCDDRGRNCSDTSEIQSSGGDDDVLISIGVIIGIAPLLLSMWRWRRPIFRGELCGWAWLLVFQCFWAMLIEVGSIYDTIRYGGNVALLVWTVSLFGLATIVMAGLARSAWGERA